MANREKHQDFIDFQERPKICLIDVDKNEVEALE